MADGKKPYLCPGKSDDRSGRLALIIIGLQIAGGSHMVEYLDNSVAFFFLHRHSR